MATYFKPIRYSRADDVFLLVTCSVFVLIPILIVVAIAFLGVELRDAKRDIRNLRQRVNALEQVVTSNVVVRPAFVLARADEQ